MAVVKHLKVAGVQIIETDGNIDWSRFKNTPSTIVSASGHNHNTTHYTTTETNDKFSVVMNTLSSIQLQIDAAAIKYKTYIGGGVSGGSSVRKYDRITESSTDLGSLLSHSPNNSASITSKEQGYMLNSNKTASGFTYSTQTSYSISNCPIVSNGSLIDYAVQTKGYITDGANAWAKLDTVTNSWENLTGTTATSAGRPMLSSTVFGFTKASGTNISYKYNYSTGVSEGTVEFTTNGTPTGLSRNSSYGYWVSNTDSNNKHAYTSNSVVQLPLFTTHFSNTNTLVGEHNGYCISGSNHTTVQKINWSTEVISGAGSSGINVTGGAGVES